jgi:hypothetical protein
VIFADGLQCFNKCHPGFALYKTDGIATLATTEALIGIAAWKNYERRSFLVVKRAITLKRNPVLAQCNVSANYIGYR